MKFTKMHGIGNDSIYVNCSEEEVTAPAKLAPIISDRHFGVGSDGLILILGNVGCGTSCRAWVKNCNLQDVYAHEIGHNLDMAHSSTDTNNDGTIDCEYCGKSDFMGYGGVGWRIVNAPHENQKQWMPLAKIQEVSVAGTATYVLSPLQADPSMTPYPQVLKVQRPTTGDWYYLSYRQRQGYDSTLAAEYVDRTSVHATSAAATATPDSSWHSRTTRSSTTQWAA